MATCAVPARPRGILIDGRFHAEGDLDCGECWSDFPTACPDPSCPGHLHAEFGDESWDGYYLLFKCDICEDTSAPD
jgi:hypothetical protein